MKQNIILTVAFLILGMSVFNYLLDDYEMNDHQDFFNEMRQFQKETHRFMNRGGRNTSQMGYETCLMQNKHSKILGVPLRDCCAVYFTDNYEECVSGR